MLPHRIYFAFHPRRFSSACAHAFTRSPRCSRPVSVSDRPERSVVFLVAAASHLRQSFSSFGHANTSVSRPGCVLLKKKSVGHQRRVFANGPFGPSRSANRLSALSIERAIFLSDSKQHSSTGRLFSTSLGPGSLRRCFQVSHSHP